MSDHQSVNTNNSTWVAVLAGLLVIGALLGYYGLANESMPVRLAVLFGGIIVALVMVAITSNGKRFIAYAKDSWNEVKKVVWPTRKETTQMTLIVFAFVAIMSIFLWSADKLIEWLIFSVFLGWK
jgi:preprotein translocase subunit SecE